MYDDQGRSVGTYVERALKHLEQAQHDSFRAEVNPLASAAIAQGLALVSIAQSLSSIEGILAEGGVVERS